MAIKCQFDQCVKTLTLVEEIAGECKCKLRFCKIHRSPEKHKCSYNFHEANTKKLETSLIEVKRAKISHF